MPLPIPVVEVGFDLTEALKPPFFTLDDATKGRLNNTQYPLGGAAFIDVTNRVRSFNFGRGRAQTFATYPAGEIEIDLNNHDRAFDPLYDPSPFRGNIVPGREVRIKVNDVIVYTGVIDDWDLSYTNDGDSTATIKASESITKLNRRFLPAFTPSEEAAGDRINAILDRSEVAWPADLRDIDTDGQTMGAYDVEAETSVLEYLQNIALSDPGEFLMSRDGKLVFQGRRFAPSSADLITFGPNDVPFDNLRVLYGSELLFNSIRLTRYTGGTVVASDLESQDEYGISELSIEEMQLATDAQMIDVAIQYASAYSQPEYRFEAFDVYLHKLDEATQNQLLEADLGDVVLAKFTPNNIGDEISRYGKIIRIDHNVTPDTHTVTFGLSQLYYAPLVLDDVVFGRLDFGRLSW